MSETKRNVPKLRFPGFTEDWEQRKFTYLLDKKEGIRRGPFGSALKKSSFVKESKYTVYEQQNAIYDRFDNRYNITKEKFDELYKFQLTPGDFIMSGAGTIGRIARVPTGIKAGVFNQALIRFKIDETLVDSEYFLEWIRSEGMQKEFTKANPGSAMVNLVPMSEVKEWEVLLPTKDEQYKIGSLLSKISSLITLHQRKLENLKLKKKALLQKLFPKNGEQFPELRFPGFTDAWEQRKLGDLAKVEMDKRIYKEQTSAEGEIPFYKIGTFGGKADSYISEDLYNEYTRKYPHPKEGDILISASGSIGRTVVYHGEKAYFQDSNIVWLNHNGALNNEFLLQFYSRVIWAGLEGSTIKRLYNKNILETEINVPDIREQKNIGEFFTQVDNLITLHQRKLEHLQLQKKALLQQMFV